MGSDKCALVELDMAKMATERYAEFGIKLDRTFGRDWWNGPEGIYKNGQLVLPRSDYRKFLDGAQKVQASVGAMNVTVAAGKDQVLGTQDDVVTIKPKPKAKKKAAPKPKAKKAPAKKKAAAKKKPAAKKSQKAKK